MQGTLLLNYDENTRQVEEEEKHKFLHSLLSQMGVPVEEFWNGDSNLSVPQKIKLRNILATYNIQAIDDLDGHMQVYVENELVGEWHKCTYKLKQDLRQLDPKKRLYLEMAIDYWSIFEEESE
jgi:hypothetical protein